MFNLLIFLAFLGREQPPPRGCVLKPVLEQMQILRKQAAASARLCVETILSDKSKPTLGCSRLRAAVC